MFILQIKGKKMFAYVIIFRIAYCFFGKRENFDLPDDNKRRKKLGWPKYRRFSQFIDYFHNCSICDCLLWVVPRPILMFFFLFFRESHFAECGLFFTIKEKNAVTFHIK